MRLLVFLLVLANLLFYAFAEGYFGQPESPDAHRVAQQIAPEKVKIVAEKELSPVAAVAVPEQPPTPVPAPQTAETPAPPPAPDPVPAKEAEVASKEVAIACSRWPALQQKDAERLAALIAKRFPDVKLSRRQEVVEGNGWWVFIPPLPDKAEADKKAGQLRGFGVTDYFVVQEPAASRFAISLGVFSSEKGAQDRLAELKEKGVRSAKLGVRPGNDDTLTLTASGPESDRAALRTAASGLLPKAKVQDCN